MNMKTFLGEIQDNAILSAREDLSINTLTKVDFSFLNQIDLPRRLLVDCENIKNPDTAVLASFLCLARKLNYKGSKLVLTNISAKMHKLIDLYQLNNLEFLEINL